MKAITCHSSSLCTLVSTALAGILTFQSHNALVEAWGKEGHEIVANIAYQHLSPKAQSIVSDILQIHDNDEKEKGDEYLSPLAKIANWADEVRSRQEYKWTTSMHYVDVRDDEVEGGCHPPQTDKDGNNNENLNSKDGCVFSYQRDCVDNVCAVGAIVNYTNILSNFYHPNNSNNKREEDDSTGSIRGNKKKVADNPFDDMRQTSLKFLTHIVGDVHQPLHVSRTTDRGGNTIKVKLVPKKKHNDNDNNSNLSVVPEFLFSYPKVDRDGKELEEKHHGHNLHSVWDSTIIEHAIYKFYDGSQNAFEESIQEDVLQDLSALALSTSMCTDGNDLDCVSTWAQESWSDALDYAYADVDGEEILNGMELDDGYLEDRMVVVKKCLGMGGLRLAGVLEAALNAVEEEEKDNVEVTKIY